MMDKNTGSPGSFTDDFAGNQGRLPVLPVTVTTVLGLHVLKLTVVIYPLEAGLGVQSHSSIQVGRIGNRLSV